MLVNKSNIKGFMLGGIIFPLIMIQGCRMLIQDRIDKTPVTQQAQKDFEQKSKIKDDKISGQTAGIKEANKDNPDSKSKEFIDKEQDLIFEIVGQPSAEQLKKVFERKIAVYEGNLKKKTELYENEKEFNKKLKDENDELRAKVRAGITENDKITAQLKAEVVSRGEDRKDAANDKAVIIFGVMIAFGVASFIWGEYIGVQKKEAIQIIIAGSVGIVAVPMAIQAFQEIIMGTAFKVASWILLGMILIYIGYKLRKSAKQNQTLKETLVHTQTGLEVAMELNGGQNRKPLENTVGRLMDKAHKEVINDIYPKVEEKAKEIIKDIPDKI